MSNLTISNLTTNGSALFQDCETFLEDLTHQEIDNTLGGHRLVVLWTSFCIY